MNKLAYIMGFAAAVCVSAYACDRGTVWDAALNAKQDVHRLCVFGKANDEQANQIAERLKKWLESDGRYLNVALERVNCDDVTVDWSKYGIPSAPPNLPAVALIGTFPSPRRAFVIDHWEPAPTDDDLAVLRTSPVREMLGPSAIDKWAVILYSPSATSTHEGAIANVVKAWNEQHPPGVEMVELDRQDARERILLGFAGIPASGGDWAGVVFGRGKLMAPPLSGDEITEANLNQLLERLPVPCTCLQESTTYGLDMPMEWTPALSGKVAAAAPVQGYVEQTLDGAAVPGVVTPMPSAPAPVAASGPELPRNDRRVMWIAGISVGSAGLVALAAMVMLMARKRE